VLEKLGGLDTPVYMDVPTPEPKAGHVVIRVNLSRFLEEKRT
jgi:NADPH:quinone reductase-like Zn-dependent oxidoreductase